MSEFFWKVFGFTILIPILAWLTISPFVCVYWVFNPNERDRFECKHGRLYVSICIGAFISCLYITYTGIKMFLIFIPGRWGTYDDEGEFVTMRSSIASVLAFLSTCFIGHLFGNIERLRRENREMKVKLQIEEMKKKFDYLDREELEGKSIELEQRIDKLQAISSSTRYLDPAQIAELDKLYELAEELQKRMQSTDN